MLPLPEYVQEAMAGNVLIQPGTATPAHRSTNDANASISTPARFVGQTTPDSFHIEQPTMIAVCTPSSEWHVSRWLEIQPSQSEGCHTN
jgi:hypothetical protein